MNIEKQNTNDMMVAVKCECGKTLAFKTESGEIIVKCRACKRHKRIKPNK